MRTCVCVREGKREGGRLREREGGEREEGKGRRALHDKSRT